MNQAVTAEELKVLLAPSRGRIRNVSSVANRTYAGRVYHSKSEATYAFQLDALKGAGRIKEWNPQVVLPIVVNGISICKVIVDFEVKPLIGKPWFVEIKGVESEVYKLKRKLLKACYPGLDYRVIRA